MNLPLRVGETRPSQLLWNFGIGAVMDLRSLSVVVSSVDQWPANGRAVVREPRLLNIVRGIFGPDVKELLGPPIRPDGSPFDPRNRDGLAHIGVSVRLFPRFLRCPLCNLLASANSGLFQLKENIFRPQNNKFVHEDCPRAKGKIWPTAISARHLVACEGGGHIDDFPWRYYVHRGLSQCTGVLQFYEIGGSTQAEELWVKCTSCSASRPMSDAFGRKTTDELPKCRGHHPHLGTYEECDKPLRTLLLGATNTWFPITRSVLAIPSNKGMLDDVVEKFRSELAQAQDLSELRGVVVGLKSQDSRIAEIELEQLWEAIQKEQLGSDLEIGHEEDIKLPEWKIFTNRPLPLNDPDFQATPVQAKPIVTPPFHEVLQVERLREVNALVGFTRVEAADPLVELEPDSRGPISRDQTPENVPAFEVRGEGIFLQFDADALSKWSARPEVTERSSILYTGHSRWRESRQLPNPQAGFPGMIYVLLHTFSHVLMRELAMECGYGAASVRERIYVIQPEEEGGKVEAGILIYTAAPDSEGTLGGLVRLAEREHLELLIREALVRSQICSSDPLCLEHDPSEDRTLHGATCHACTFVSETSCEMANRYLDRRLLIKSEHEPLGFFELT